MTDSKVTAPEQPERLDVRSEDIAAARREELLRLFPETRTEDGQIDFAQLQRALGETIDPGKERYGLTWPGKADCFKTIQAPSLGTLLPLKADSINWDTTENLIIEGDNLEVLKLLQKSYLGKVKMIYIDPPYNTGNDFIYPDDYAESLKTYLEYTGQADEAGRRFSTNTDTDGRFHSKWLNMMYPRLYLARNLLRDDGLIFISIDDHEVENILRLGDEVFGEENFAGLVTRGTGTPTGGGGTIFTNLVDYLAVYSRSAEAVVGSLPFSPDDERIYDQEDERGRYLTRSLRRTGGEDRRQDRPSMYYAIPGPDGVDVYPTGPTGYESRWICGRAKYQELVTSGLIEWKRVKDHSGELVWRPFQKFYLEGRQKQPSNLWTDLEGNKKATRDLRDLFGDKVFDSPKPVALVRRCLDIGSTSTDSIVLDFFAGSGTTAHAVLDLNRHDGGKRRFILAQLPEPTDREDYPTITAITKERVRRVISRLNAEDPNGAAKEDRGFRVFRLAESNIAAWDGGIAHDERALAEQLELHVDHVRDDRSPEDVLYEILLKSGFPLSTRVESIVIEETAVTSVAEGALLICLDQALSLELVRAVAARNPERAVFLDEGFAGNDALKANAAQVFKAAGVTFRTV